MDFIKKINKEEIKLHGLKKITKYMLLFMATSIIGWIYEEILFLIQFGKETNRGFFYGPYLPVYGVGAILVTNVLKKYKKNPILIFILSMFLAGFLEWLVGFMVYEIWDKRLWDYEGEFLNIDRFVCLKSAISFGFCGILIIYFLEPIINNFTYRISKKHDVIINIIIPIILIIDLLFVLIYRYPI